MNTVKLRVARPTNNFEEILKFYRDGLGLEVIGKFSDHQGFDGLMLGAKELPYHFEFTLEHGHTAPPSPSKDHLMVFYVPDVSEYQSRIARMEAAGFVAKASYNPYWDQKGKTFEDFEGYRVVIFNGGWDV